MKKPPDKRIRLLLFAIISKEFGRLDRVRDFAPLMWLDRKITAMLLLQYQFKLCKARDVEIDFVIGEKNGLMSLEFKRLNKVDAVQGYRVTYEIEKTFFEAEPEASLLAACHASLIALSQRDGADDGVVDLVFKRLLEEGDSARIDLNRVAKTIGKYAITPFIRIMKPSMHSDTSLYVQVEDRESGRSGILHLAQERFDLVVWLCEKVKIEKGNLICKPTPALWVDAYRQRGFQVPISVPIEDFFNPEFSDSERLYV